MRRHISCITIAILLFQSFVMAQNPAGPSAAALPPSIDDVLGKWRSEDGEYVDIKLIEPYDKGKCASRPCGVILHGKHDWGGIFGGGSLGFIIAPNSEVMNQNVPGWARKQVEGKLRWELTLKYEEQCDGPVLAGSWYPGEVDWTEEKNPDSGNVIKQEARVVGRGAPRKIVFHKTEESQKAGDESVEDEAPYILLRHAERQYPLNEYLYGVSGVDSFDVLLKGQPFFVEVRTHVEGNPASPVSVTLRSAQVGGSVNLKLEAFQYPGGLTIYTTKQPIRIQDQGAGVENIGLKAANQDTVTVTYGTSSRRFTICDSWVQLGIVANERNLLLRLALCNWMFYDAKTRDEQALWHQKIQIVNNARHVINDYQPPEKLPLDLNLTNRGPAWEKMTDYTRFYVGQEYLRVLDGTKAIPDPSNPAYPSKYRGWSSHLNPQLGIVVQSLAEQVALDDALEESYGLYEQKFMSTAAETMKGLAVTVRIVGLLLIASNAVVQTINESSAVFFGEDIFGDRVETTDRILAGVSLGLKVAGLSLGALSALRTALREAEALSQVTREVNALRLIEAEEVASEVALVEDAAPGARTAFKRWANETNFEEPITATPLNSVGTRQQFPGTKICGARTLEGMLKDGGKMGLDNNVSTLWTLVEIKAYQLVKTTVGGNFLGMWPKQMARALIHFGAKPKNVRLVRNASLYQIKKEIEQGRFVAQVIKTDEAGKYLHWVRVEGFKCEAGLSYVHVGDPAAQTSLMVGFKTFARRMFQGTRNGESAWTVIAEF